MTAADVVLPSDLDRARAPQLALAEAVAAGKVRMTDILKSIGVEPNNPTHQAALLACERYDLDPLMKHLVVIPGSGPYITRDGWLHIAHRHGEFDGMEVMDEGDTDTHWWARVAVYRKDMGRPFSYRGRYPKKGRNAQYGPEMAVKVAEVAALRRAFPVAGVGAYEERWDAPDTDVERASIIDTTTGEITAGDPTDDASTLDLDGDPDVGE